MLLGNNSIPWFPEMELVYSTSALLSFDKVYESKIENRGLLYDWEEKSEWSGIWKNINISRKSCLRNKCAQDFGTKPEVLQECLLLDDSAEAAGNTNVGYTDIKCPDIVKSK